MDYQRLKALGAALAIACASLGAAAQVEKKDEPKKAEAKKDEPKKAEKKAAPAKTAPPAKPAQPAKKTTQPEKKPAQPVKAAPGTSQTLGPGSYSTGPTTLRDKDGNVIPTNPDAYNVDSAVKKK